MLMSTWIPRGVPKEPALLPMNPLMMHAMLFSSSMVTIGMAVLSKSEKTDMQAVDPWDMVVAEVDSKVVMEHAEVSVVAGEAIAAVEASVVAPATLVEAMQEEEATVVVVAAAAAGMAAVSRNRLRPTLSPTSQRQGGREAQSSMPEM